MPPNVESTKYFLDFVVSTLQHFTSKYIVFAMFFRTLDAEERVNYEVVLSITDGKLGAGNFIQRSLLILVEDINDNVPVFLYHPPSVKVREDAEPGTVIGTLLATDADSGIFGRVVYSIDQR